MTLRHVWADCLKARNSSGPNAHIKITAFTVGERTTQSVSLASL